MQGEFREGQVGWVNLDGKKRLVRVIKDTALAGTRTSVTIFRANGYDSRGKAEIKKPKRNVPNVIIQRVPDTVPGRVIGRGKKSTT